MIQHKPRLNREGYNKLSLMGNLYEIVPSCINEINQLYIEVMIKYCQLNNNNFDNDNDDNNNKNVRRQQYMLINCRR